MLWKAFSLKGAQQSWKYLGLRHSFLRPIGTADFFFWGVTPLQDKKQQHMLGLLHSFQITGQCCILSLYCPRQWVPGVKKPFHVRRQERNQ